MIVGIDLGTSNSCLVSDVELEVVPSPMGSNLTPSYVCVGPTQITCGELAKQKQTEHPRCTFYEFKRTVGLAYRQRALWTMVEQWPFKLGKPKSMDDPPLYSAMLNGDLKQLTSGDLYVHLLEYMTRPLTKRVDMAVVTVPAKFTSPQRDATVRAVQTALPHARVEALNEPTAAALTYITKCPVDPGATVLVLDVGGGTTDVTLLRVSSKENIKVLDTKGDDVGGAKFTDRIVNAALKHCGKQKPSTQGMVMLRDRAEELKRTLSAVESADLSFAGICDVDPLTISRRTFVDMIQHDIVSITQCAAMVAGPNPPNHLVLCGGTTRIPALRERLARMFNKTKISTDVNPDTAVAKGAVLYGQSLPALAASPHQPAAAAASAAPVATIQEILGSSVGVRSGAHGVYVLVSKGTRIPCRVDKEFAPADKRQKEMEVVVTQGEEKHVDNNAILGRYMLSGNKDILLSINVDHGGRVDLVVQRGNEKLLDVSVK